MPLVLLPPNVTLVTGKLLAVLHGIHTWHALTHVTGPDVNEHGERARIKLTFNVLHVECGVRLRLR
jgi:hypothetical protein